MPALSTAGFVLEKKTVEALWNWIQQSVQNKKKLTCSIGRHHESNQGPMIMTKALKVLNTVWYMEKTMCTHYIKVPNTLKLM